MEDYTLIAEPLAAGQDYPSEPLEQRSTGEAVQPAPKHRRSRRTRAHLAPWQAKLARDMMLSQMANGLALIDIAVRLNMSVNHFIKAFRETEGISPYHWYMQRRIAQAMALLRDEAMPLSKVANECGFADQSHFTKAFTRLLGISPGRWRRRARPEASATGG